MTAKEWIEENEGNVHDNPNIDNDSIAEMMNQYALQIAEKAVEEEKRKWCKTYERPFNDLLSRIKNEIGVNNE